MPASEAERTLSRRELNRALLARQLLLERVSDPIPRVLERMGGLQAQYAPSMYIGLWSRIEDLERDAVTHGLEQRTVVQGTLMRATIHLVSTKDYWPFALGAREARKRAWVGVARRGFSEDEVAAAAGRLREALAEGPLRRKEIEGLLGDRVLANGAGMWLDLIRMPPSGTWERRRADLYELAERWLGPPEVTPEEGIERLVRRYLEGFGPGPATDLANWAGLPLGEVMPALGRLGLRRFRDERGAELVDLPDASLPDPETPAPVRFLPTWDAALLAHARRTGILPEEHRPKVFSTKTPQSVPTFLVDGEVAGTWRYEKGSVRTEPFGRLAAATRRELEEEAERLAAFNS